MYTGDSNKNQYLLTSQLEAFYRKQGVHVNNKYFVLLYGAAVGGAAGITSFRGSQENVKMNPTDTFPFMSIGDTSTPIINNLNMKNQLNDHAIKAPFEFDFDYGDVQIYSGHYMMSMLWNCASISIPDTKFVLKDDVNLDFNTANRDKMIMGVNDGDITMTIVDDAKMSMHSFFSNMAKYYTTAYNGDAFISKPRSAFRKLGMCVVTIGNGNTSNTNISKSSIETLLNMHIFKSITLSSISGPKLSYDSKEIYKFDVTLSTTTPIQEIYSLKTSEVLKNINKDITSGYKGTLTDHSYQVSGDNMFLLS
jgi:hypothetical protein